MKLFILAVLAAIMASCSQSVASQSEQEKGPSTIDVFTSAAAPEAIASMDNLCGKGKYKILATQSLFPENYYNRAGIPVAGVHTYVTFKCERG